MRVFCAYCGAEETKGREQPHDEGCPNAQLEDD